MDFAPGASQQILVATARQFLAERCDLSTWGAPGAPQTPLGGSGRPGTAAAPLDDTLWRAMAELGWQGLLVPAELGGSGGSLLDMSLLVEEMGRVCLPGPFIASAVTATTALAAANEALAKRTLGAMADGARMATLALVEESASFALDTVSLACEVPGQLTGRKLFVKDAHLADDLIVAVRGGGDLTLLILPADRRGVGRRPLDAGSGERLFEVTFERVEVSADDVIGSPGRGREPLVAALRAGALARTAEMVGAAQRVLELVVAHAKTRVQGGRPIGGHQAIQHACADLVRDVDASRGLLYAAAWKTAEGERADAEVAMAKAYAGQACLRVARRAHQIFGAISYCEEHPLHLFHKRIQAASLDYGDPDLHLETVARAIGLH